MSEGHQGIALPYHRPPSGLVPGGELQGTHRQGGAGIPGPQLRASFQRAALPEPFFVPVHHPYHEGTHAAAEQLLRPLQGAYPPQGGPGQGRHPPLPGSRGAVRAYHLRFRAGPSGTAHDGGDHRKGKGGRPGGEILLPLAGGHHHAGGHPARGRGNAHRRQTALGAYAFRRGRPALRGTDGRAL